MTESTELKQAQEIAASFNEIMESAKQSWQSQLRKEIEVLVGNNRVYLLPPGCHVAYGFQETDGSYRIKAIEININDLSALQETK
jgi:hypothetical protein